MIDVTRLYTTLLNTGLQIKDNALYQVIHDIIAALLQTNTTITTIGSSSTSTIKPNQFEAYISLKVL